MADEASWTSELETDPRMDGEHRAQIELIQALERAIDAGDSRERIDELLQSLIDTTDVHFMSEQVQMRESAYPHYAAHLREHERLLEEVKTFRAQWDAAGEGGVDPELLRGLQRWLKSHIRGMDRRFGEYLEASRSS